MTGCMIDLMNHKEVGPGETIRLCRSSVIMDTVLETTNIKKRGDFSVNEFACQVASVEALSDDVFRVVLRLPAGKNAEFVAGQYLSINMPESDPAFFSIASQPGTREVELHVQASPERESAMSVLSHLRDSLTVKVSLPYGKACLTRLPENEVVLIGAGTGYAQLKAIIDGMLQQSFSLPITLFWGGREKRDLYLLEEAVDFAGKYPNVDIIPVFVDTEDNDWQGHHDQLLAAVLSKYSDLNGVSVYASGSPGLVYAALDAFKEVGLQEADFYSDVLEYAPRN